MLQVQVPSLRFPTVAAAVEAASPGTLIRVEQGHTETLLQPMIIDKAICICGPADNSAQLDGEGLIVAAGPNVDSVVLSRLRLRSTHGGAALLLAGGCSIERCEVDTGGQGVGVEVTASTSRLVRLLRCVVRDCEVGVSVAGATAALLEGTHIERCRCAVSLTGLDVQEGWCDVLQSLATASLALNEVDLKLRGWSVLEKAGAIRRAPATEVAGPLRTATWWCQRIAAPWCCTSMPER